MTSLSTSRLVVVANLLGLSFPIHDGDGPMTAMRTNTHKARIINECLAASIVVMDVVVIVG